MHAPDSFQGHNPVTLAQVNICLASPNNRAVIIERGMGGGGGLVATRNTQQASGRLVERLTHSKILFVGAHIRLVFGLWFGFV